MNKPRFSWSMPLVRRATLVLALALSMLTGCSAYTPNQNPYMLTGAGLGGATGAALGIATSPNNPWKGAAIGGLLGAALGGIGGEMYGRTVNPPPYYQGYQQPGYSQAPSPGYTPAPQPGYSYAQPPSPGYTY